MPGNPMPPPEGKAYTIIGWIAVIVWLGLLGCMWVSKMSAIDLAVNPGDMAVEAER